MEECKKKFELGWVVVTRGVRGEMERNHLFRSFVQKCISRHISGDWGDLDPEDFNLNDKALATGGDKLFSVYKSSRIPDGKIWIITEWDRSATTILFPSEY